MGASDLDRHDPVACLPMAGGAMSLNSTLDWVVLTSPATAVPFLFFIKMIPSTIAN